MVKLPRFLTLLAIVGLLFACQTETAEETGATEEAAASDAAAVRTEIETLGDGFEKAFLAEDASTIGTYYKEDAVALPPGTPRAPGRAAIEALFADWFAQVPAPEIFTLTTDDLVLAGSGEIAYEIGTYHSKGASPEGEAHEETGKYVVVWENVNGEWKIAADIWNGDAPMHMEGEVAPATEAPETAQPDAGQPAE